MAGVRRRHMTVTQTDTRKKRIKTENEPGHNIRRIGDGDLARIRISFHFQNQDQWKQYYEENMRGERVTLLAIHNDQVVGYTNLVWRSNYQPYQAEGPEINDMHIKDNSEKQGIGNALIQMVKPSLRGTGKKHWNRRGNVGAICSAQRLYLSWVMFQMAEVFIRHSGETAYMTGYFPPLPFAVK